ncbi:MAG: hypothetical protein RBT80_27455, partial [Candidatus Vecturithrix sp.]|nr:hypothetical protein [Candidatus Vecturithrix sp.]
MPITAIIRLRAQTTGKVSRSFHVLMHPLVLDRIAQVSLAMSSMIHDSQSMSPFSLSPVMDVRAKIRENQSCWARIGILNNEFQEIFVRTLEQGIWQQPIHLEQHVFQVEDIIWGQHEDYPWSGYDSYSSLLTDIEMCDSVP